MKRFTILFLMLLIAISITGTFSYISETVKADSDSKGTSDVTKLVAEIIPGTIYVKFLPRAGKLDVAEGATLLGIPSIDKKLARFSVSSIKKAFRHKPIPPNSNLPDISRIYKLTFPSSYDPVNVAREFARDPNVEYAEPIYMNHVDETPNDPMYNQQEHLPQIQAPQAWGVQKGDSAIVIAIVDNGTDYEHPDLADNVWTNEAEANGLPGIDDDNNGYVDDIHGWDIAENDNDPTNPPRDQAGYWLHGTHTAGLATAVTNNNLGVAAIAWNCEYMPVKVSYDANPRSVPFGYEGIVYAADNGADVISNSWGGFGRYSQTGQDIINYAYGKGSVIVAAAGNSLTSNFHYPSSYANVLGVTWVDFNDILSPSGTYGIAVDVSAPGINILSTIPYKDGAYGRISGSSMACPIVAGLCGLVKSRHPDWSNDQIVRQVVLTADNIDNLNPGYEGLLGSGRINAYRAVTETELTEVPPKLQVFQTSPTDSVSGDNDGLYERGETISVYATWRNYSLGAATNTVFTLTTNDPELQIVGGTVAFGTVPADTFVSLDTPFSFSINANASGHMATLYLNWSADGGFSGVDSLKVIIGKMPILIVDDDDGDNNVEGFYTTILDNWGLNYALWDHVALGSPSAAQLSNFPIVIWLCEWAFPSLDELDRNAIASYLDSGGNLFISGQDIGWDFNDPGGYAYGSQDFYNNYLHAIYYADDSPVQDVVGIIGDEIGDGLSFSIYQPGRPTNYQFPDEIEPATGATTVFEYVGGEHHKAGIKYAGTHKVVYLPYGFEAIDAVQGTPPTEFSPIRTEVLNRILNWVNSIVHQPLGDTETLTDPLPVNCTLTGDLSDLISVNLYWKKEGDATFTQVDMDSLGNGQYSAEIPAPMTSTTIEYYIETENPYFKWQSPPGAPNMVHRFYAGPDVVAPTISHTKPGDTINGENPFHVLVGVTDNIGVDNSSVYLHYSASGVTDSVQLTPTGLASQFEGYIPAVAAYGDTMTYYITARDVAASPNTGVSDTYQFLVGYEDFESGLTHWAVYPEGWGLEIAFAHSGKYSVNDSPGQPYPNNANTSLTLNFGLDLSQTDKASLFYWTMYYLEINHDYGYVEVSTDGGTNWEQLGDRYNGIQSRFVEDSRSLSNYCGPGFTDVRIRFRMQSDSTQIPPFLGWFIDDVRIVEGIDVAVESRDVSDKLPQSFSLSQNYPNPFNPDTEIRFQLPQAAHVSLKIYNLLGQEVRTLVDAKKDAGYYTIRWDGKDNQSQDVASGVYIYRIKAGRFMASKKMLFIR